MPGLTLIMPSPHNYMSQLLEHVCVNDLQIVSMHKESQTIEVFSQKFVPGIFPGTNFCLHNSSGRHLLYVVHLVSLQKIELATLVHVTNQHKKANITSKQYIYYIDWALPVPTG